MHYFFRAMELGAGRDYSRMWPSAARPNNRRATDVPAYFDQAQPNMRPGLVNTVEKQKREVARIKRRLSAAALRFRGYFACFSAAASRLASKALPS